MNRIGTQVLYLFIFLSLLACGGEENTFLADVDHVPPREGLIAENNSTLFVRRIFSLVDENYISSEHFVVFYGLNAGPLETESRLILQEAEAAWDLGIMKHQMKRPARIETSYIPILLEGTDVGISDIAANGTYLSQRAYYIALKSSAFLNTIGGSNTGSVEVVREVFKTFIDPPGFSAFDYSRWYADGVIGMLIQELYPGNVRDLDFGVAYTMNPQLPLWSYDTYLNLQTGESEFTWSEENRSAGTEVFLRYLVDNEILTIDEILDPLKSSRDFNALAYLKETLDTKSIALKDVFSDFCTRTVTWDYAKHGTSFEEIQAERIANHSHRIITDTIRLENVNATFNSIPDFAPTQWSYNVLLLEHDGDANYDLTFSGDEFGTNGTAADFVVTVVRKTGASRTYQTLQLSNGLNGSLTLDGLSQGEEVYLVVVSAPDVYEGDMDFFNYSLEINRLD